MGLIEDAANRTRLAKLLRYATSKSGDKEISLEDYVANMKEEQKNIYYISGEDKETLLKSPSVEKLLAKDIEIIFMTDSVDECARPPQQRVRCEHLPQIAMLPTGRATCPYSLQTRYSTSPNMRASG